jgi:hypothetical protein
MNPRLFAALPADLTSLDADGLAAAIQERRDIIARIQANDAELLPADQFTAEQILDELEAGVEQIKLLEAEVSLKAEAVAEFERRVASLASDAGVQLAMSADGDADDTDETTETTEEETTEEETTETEAVVEEPEAVVAAALPIRRRLPAPTPEREAVVVEASGPRGLVASADFASDIPVGSDLSRRDFARLAIAAAGRISPTKAMPRVEQPLARVTWDAPEDRILRDSDPEGNADKIMAVIPFGMSTEALVASGGLCAPLTPIYDLPQIATEARPVRDNLPAFQAARGGITWATPPSIADVSTGVGLITAEEDGEGGTFATKTCQFLDCDAFNSAEIAAIYHCLEWGNIGARAWPERVAQFTDVVMAAWSRLAEINLLNLMKAGSTQVTAAAATYGYGALSDFTSQILVAAAGYRNRFRMDANSRFRVVAPTWMRDIVLADLINSQFDRFAIQGYDGVDAFLRLHLIDPIWTIDGENDNTDTQFFADQGAGALVGYPDEQKWFLFPEGTWIWVTMGTLELGIVRDSVLNALNDFQVFGEGFETIAQVGYQSLEITSNFCSSGSTGGPVTAITCS